LVCVLILLWSLPVVAARSLLLVSDSDNSVHQAIVDHLRTALDGEVEGGAEVSVERLATQQLSEGIPANFTPGLIVTIGTKAAAEVDGRANGVPVLNVFLPQAAHRQLAASGGHGAAAIVLDQPIRRQLAVARALLPEARSAGLLQGQDMAGEMLSLTQGAVDFGLDLHITRLEDSEDPAAAIEEVLRVNDVVIATFDPKVYTPATAKWLLYLAFQQQRPIVGFSYALLKAGAVAAVFSTPEQIARHAADAIADWLRSGVPPSGTAYPRYYHIGLNAPVAKRLGVSTPSEPDLERQVHTLLGEVR